jgi:ribosomal protein L30E
MKIIIALILGLAAFIVVYAALDRSSKTDIEAWAKTQGYKVLSIEQTIVDLGPYYVKPEGRRIYRCVLLDGNGHRRLMYMRTGLFANDYEFYGDAQ